MSDMNKLRDRAREWLDKYKAGEPCSGLLDTEDKAAIVAEYLHETEVASEVDVLHMDLAEAQAKNIHLREEIDEMRKQRDEVLTRLRMRDLDIDRYRAKVEAYEFVIRCNGVSGAEVHT